MKIRVILLFIILLASIVQAKTSISYNFNVKAPVGISISKFKENGIGFYTNVNFNDGIVIRDISYETVRYGINQKTKTRHILTTFGVNYLCNSNALYVGIGLHSALNQYQYNNVNDPFTEWEKGFGYNKYGVNINAGTQIIGWKNTLITLGIDSNPLSFSGGIGRTF